MEKHTRGQSTLEYVILVAVVVATLLIAQFYVKHAVTGRLKSSADSIGDQWDMMNSKFVVKVTSLRESEDRVSPEGVSTSKLTADEEQSRTTTDFTINAPTATSKIFDF